MGRMAHLQARLVAERDRLREVRLAAGDRIVVRQYGTDEPVAVRHLTTHRTVQRPIVASVPRPITAPRSSLDELADLLRRVLENTDDRSRQRGPALSTGRTLPMRGAALAAFVTANGQPLTLRDVCAMTGAPAGSLSGVLSHLVRERVLVLISPCRRGGGTGNGGAIGARYALAETDVDRRTERAA